MNKKGVSTIIATILLVMIAIGLVGTAYIYFSGIMSGKTKHTISLVDAYCNQTNQITLVVSNDGTNSIEDSQIQVLIDNNDRSTEFVFPTIEPQENGIATGTTNEGTGRHTVLVVSPTNTARQVVNC